MANLIYSAIASLDGYTADSNGDFDWAAPDEEVHAFVNDNERSIGTYLYGRRMYETMVYWETAPTGDDQPAVVRDYARIWQAADKVVYSSTLDAVSSTRTRIEREFDPDAVRRLKKAFSPVKGGGGAVGRAAERDVSVGGPGLAAQALAAGLVDECHLFLNPVVVGGGTRALPAGLHLELELLDQRRFGNGVVYLRYRVG
jgi:dihydrofolate reductase